MQELKPSIATGPPGYLPDGGRAKSDGVVAGTVGWNSEGLVDLSTLIVDFFRPPKEIPKVYFGRLPRQFWGSMSGFATCMIYIHYTHIIHCIHTYIYIEIQYIDRNQAYQSVNILASMNEGKRLHWL